MIDAAAEPSVLAGIGGSPAYAIDTNRCGTIAGSGQFGKIDQGPSRCGSRGTTSGEPARESQPAPLPR